MTPCAWTRSFASGLDLYPAAALSVAIGWVLLSLDWWRTANGLAYVPVLFTLSIVTGLVGQIAPHAATLSVASGVIVGAATLGVGRQVLLTTIASDDALDVLE